MAQQSLGKNEFEHVCLFPRASEAKNDAQRDRDDCLNAKCGAKTENHNEYEKEKAKWKRKTCMQRNYVEIASARRDESSAKRGRQGAEEWKEGKKEEICRSYKRILRSIGPRAGANLIKARAKVTICRQTEAN